MARHRFVERAGGRCVVVGEVGRRRGVRGGREALDLTELPRALSWVDGEVAATVGAAARSAPTARAARRAAVRGAVGVAAAVAWQAGGGLGECGHRSSLVAAGSVVAAAVLT